ncbi:MAG: YggS family pyridoxal phosphate-dependent enzyme [Pseudarcicella sp.]|nr:YggS family pyridoxal phosphate-dependent enzyme [Pseudarcicella sp.]MBP6411570.1 YggS family pyridoxal phosphate-dependent enzyme [Pseudarcicella sp.]
MTIKQNIATIYSQLQNSKASLIAVTKTKPVADLQEAYDAGCKVFGENKVQEMVDKQSELPADIEWHLIGHLQTNKVKFIAPFVAMIHAVDSMKLLIEINKQAQKNNRVIPCLLQIFIAQEETKFGLSQDEALAILNDAAFGSLENIKIVGLMGMATFTDNMEQVRNEFKSLKNIFDQMQLLPYQKNVDFCEISMGMSGDYMIAIEEGSTLVRVGSAIFGGR